MLKPYLKNYLTKTALIIQPQIYKFQYVKNSVISLKLSHTPLCNRILLSARINAAHLIFNIKYALMNSNNVLHQFHGKRNIITQVKVRKDKRILKYFQLY